MEYTDLPGNDASWYQALLDDEDAERVPVESPPADSHPDATISDPAAELGAAGPIEGVTPTDDSFEASALVDVPEVMTEDRTSTAPLPTLPEEGITPETEDTSTELADDPAVELEAPGAEAESEDSEVPPLEPIEPNSEGFGEKGDGLSAAQAAPTLVATGSRGADEPSPMEKTSEMVGQLWTARQADEPLAGWEPDEMDRKMSSARHFRWTSVAAGLAVIALIIIGLVLLPSIARSRAANHMEMMTAALHQLRAELPDTQTTLGVATEPDSTVTALNDLSTQLTSLSAKATAVNNAGRMLLPAVPPFTSSGPIDELVPVQQRLEPLATTALTIQRRIANLVQYRTLMHDFLVLPELPTEADAEVQADLRVALASAQAESASILAELPEDVSLSEHRSMAREINERFATWQVDYLEALRNGDPIAAETLVTELLASLDALDAELVTPLAQIRRQTDADLIDLASSIDNVVSLAAQTDPLP